MYNGQERCTCPTGLTGATCESRMYINFAFNCIPFGQCYIFLLGSRPLVVSEMTPLMCNVILILCLYV